MRAARVSLTKYFPGHLLSILAAARSLPTVGEFGYQRDGIYQDPFE